MAIRGLIGWVIVFHLFGVIIWIGSLLLISSMLSLVTEEADVARERMILVSRRLFHVACNIGAAVTVFFGILLMVLEPDVLMRGWLHVKLALVAILLYFHYRLYRRIMRLENDPTSVSAREFRMSHGIISLLLLAILALAVLQPF